MGDWLEIIINSQLAGVSDRSGHDKIHAAKDATIKIVNFLPEDAHFFIVTGAGKATVVFPVSPATNQKKQEAIAAIKGTLAL